MRIRLLLLALLGALLVPTAVQAQSSVFICLGPPAIGACAPVSATNPMPVTGSISASIGGFQPSASGARGTPVTVTTSDSSGTLPTGAVVVVSNVGSNPMYCNVNGVAATVSDQYIASGGGQFPFTIPAAITTLHCIATGGSTTANMVGGTGISTGTGGGSGGGGGGAVTLAATAVASGAYSAGSIGSGAFASGAIASGAIAAGAQVDLLTMRGSKAPGTAAANSLLTGGIYTAAGITLTDGQQAAIQFDAAGNMKVTGIGVANASATSGQTLSPVGAAASTSPPTTTNGNTYFLSMDTLGGLRTSTLNNGVGVIAATTPTNSVSEGCRGQNAENTAVTNGQLTNVACDLVGKQVVLPYANPENITSGVTAAMTGTTPTSLIASPGGSLRNYATLIYCVNSHATVSTFVNVTDGSGGTVLWSIYAGAAGGGAGPSFITPLRQPTTATALFVVNVTTGANVVCNASGYKGL
jgi:hypothetical protein